MRMTACVEGQQIHLQQLQQNAEREKVQLTRAHRAEAAQALLQSQQAAQDTINARELQNQALLGQQQQLQDMIQQLEQQRVRETQRLRDSIQGFQEQQEEIMNTFKFRDLTTNIGPKKEQ